MIIIWLKEFEGGSRNTFSSGTESWKLTEGKFDWIYFIYSKANNYYDDEARFLLLYLLALLAQFNRYFYTWVHIKHVTMHGPKRHDLNDLWRVWSPDCTNHTSLLSYERHTFYLNLFCTNLLTHHSETWQFLTRWGLIKKYDVTCKNIKPLGLAVSEKVFERFTLSNIKQTSNN